MSAKPTLFILLSRFPYPLIKGDKLRAYYQIKELSNTFDIHLHCISDEEISLENVLKLKPYCSNIKIYRIWKIVSWANALRYLFSTKPAQVGYFYRFWIQQKINKELKNLNPNRIYCQLIRVAEYLFHYHNTRKTIDYMDALSKGVERRIALSKWHNRWVFKREATNLLHYENLCFDYFDSHTIISEVDRNCIYHNNRNQIQIVKNGVDASHFEDLGQTKTIDVIFTGNMAYPPNIEAAEFIYTHILPLLIAQKSKIKVVVVGTSMPEYYIKKSNDTIQFLGYVKDLRTYIQRSKTYLAPMKIGTGLQNKLLEAMAAGVPAITTSLCNSSLFATPLENILISETAEEFATSILNLLEDPVLSSQIANNATFFVRSKYSWQAETEILKNVILA